MMIRSRYDQARQSPSTLDGLILRISKRLGSTFFGETRRIDLSNLEEIRLYSTGSAMNVIPALGVYAALRREAGLNLPFPGGAPRVAQAIDADLLARAIAWAGEATSTRNEIFNITNGDVFVWENIWPAIAASLGMRPGGHVPLSLDRDIRPREEEWETICAQHGLRSGNLRDQLVEATKELLWEVGFEAMSPRDIQARSAPSPADLMAAVRPHCEATVSAAIPDRG
jgi:nucleoside-diphosphate-sugar epimerase